MSAVAMSGELQLVAHVGGDLSVVNSARVSLGKRKDAVDEADQGLIRYLMSNRHGTPFEHNAFTFYARSPIFVAREWFRHRIGSFNEFSTRYTEMPDDCWVPELAHVRTQVGKPGHYRFESMEALVALPVIEEVAAAQGAAFATYRSLLGQGVSREVARMVLPIGAMTEFYWTLNARSLMNFLSLRNHPTALLEIRLYAEAIEGMFLDAMPVTAHAFIESGRVAP